MCGFAGFLIDDTNVSTISRFSIEQRNKLLGSMGAAIAHRGPDQQDEWLSEDGQCGFAHRRLSIIDLSPSGQQPMTSQCGRFVIVYNGMVYNYRSIAKELSNENVRLRGSSDTEVILEAIAFWGFLETLEKLHGMFAIVLYDKLTGSLSFARDRMGEKPLYVGSHDGQIVFASELKALQPLFSYRLSEEGIERIPRKPDLNRHAIGLYLRHGYVPTPYSIFRTIFKLPAANMVTITQEQRHAFIKQPNQWLSAFTPYWSLKVATQESAIQTAAIQTSTRQNSLSTVDLQSEFTDLLDTVVDREMHADVPLGAFLSGGVDSSTIVAVMQNLSKQKGGDTVRTFSIGFEQERFNEAPFAAAVAKHLGTQHHEQIITIKDAQGVIPDLAKIYDEPFADSSQIPTVLVSKLAREHVTVSLSGDGGDELFGGYERYDWANNIWQKVSWMPLSARQSIASMLQLLSRFNAASAPSKIQNIAAKFDRLSAMLSAENRQYFYRILISAGVDAQQLVLQDQEIVQSNDFLSQEQCQGEEFLHQMMFLDIQNYLPDDILTKVDRASMSVSLESRVPLLDHAIVEQAWKMRNDVLNRKVSAKQALRKVLYQSVPKELIERPKRGFAIPLGDWLRGDLLDWADALLDQRRLASEGIFDSEKVSEIWENFKNGRVGSEHLLWSILMFQLWHEQWYQ